MTARSDLGAWRPSPLAAVLPNHVMMEIVDAGRDAVFRSDHHLEDGWVVLGDAPGLGIAFDEQRLAQQMVDRPSPQSLGAIYPRATGSGISEPGILARAWSDDAPS